MFLNFSNGNLITFKLHIDTDKILKDNDNSFHVNELYKYNVNVNIDLTQWECVERTQFYMRSDSM